MTHFKRLGAEMRVTFFFLPHSHGEIADARAYFPQVWERISYRSARTRTAAAGLRRSPARRTWLRRGHQVSPSDTAEVKCRWASAKVTRAGRCDAGRMRGGSDLRILRPNEESLGRLTGIFGAAAGLPVHCSAVSPERRGNHLFKKTPLWNDISRDLSPPYADASGASSFAAINA